MFGIGFILLMLGASGITDQRGNLQMVPTGMVFIGMIFLLIGQRRREKR